VGGILIAFNRSGVDVATVAGGLVFQAPIVVPLARALRGPCHPLRFREGRGIVGGSCRSEPADDRIYLMATTCALCM
jgi:hypothetical protein